MKAVCFSCDVETPSKQVLDLFGGTVSVEGGKKLQRSQGFIWKWPNVDTKTLQLFSEKLTFTVAQ